MFTMTSVHQSIFIHPFLIVLFRGVSIRGCQASFGSLHLRCFASSIGVAATWAGKAPRNRIGTRSRTFGNIGEQLGNLFCVSGENRWLLLHVTSVITWICLCGKFSFWSIFSGWPFPASRWRRWVWFGVAILPRQVPRQDVREVMKTYPKAHVPWRPTCFFSKQSIFPIRNYQLFWGP